MRDGWMHSAAQSHRPLPTKAAPGILTKRPAQPWSERGWCTPPPVPRSPSSKSLPKDEKENGLLHSHQWELVLGSAVKTDAVPEEVTPSGIAHSKMMAAVSTTTCGADSIAQAVNTALVRADQRIQDEELSERPVRLSVTSALAAMESDFKRELCPARVNHVARVTKMLRKHRERLQAQFAAWDADGDGQISKLELGQAMTMLGLEVNSDEVDAFFDQFDPDQSGTLDMKELYGVAYAGRQRHGR